MTEAQSSAPNVVKEVNIGDAVYGLTTQNAIFRNGQQLVIPHLGVEFLPELMAALSTEEFIQGIAENRLRQDDEFLAAADQCGDEHEAGAKCDLPFQHEGPHHAWMGAPADWGGGDSVIWHDHPVEENPVVTGNIETDWDGFHIEPEPDDEHPGAAKVWHVNLPEAWLLFRGPRDADMTQADNFATLCATAYLWWFHQAFPEGPAPADWERFAAGDFVYSDEGVKGLIIAGNDRVPLALVTQESMVITVEEGNAEELSHWTAGARL